MRNTKETGWARKEAGLYLPALICPPLVKGSAQRLKLRLSQEGT